MADVPISPKTLDWLIKESGRSTADLDKKLKLAEGTVQTWIDGDSKPNRTQFNKVKAYLKRPAAIFFMDTPPVESVPKIELRFALNARQRSQTFEERCFIGDAKHMQGFFSELQTDLGRIPVQIESVSQNEDPEEVARRVRSSILKISVEEQRSWQKHSNAFRQWRWAIENLGIFVFAYPLGESGSRGFSLATEVPYVVGVNTWFQHPVRIYTLFHELGHILTRTSSLCTESVSISRTYDQIERWCEQFAASFLMPKETVEELMGDRQAAEPMGNAAFLAKELLVSWKAASLRLIELGLADWGDFNIHSGTDEIKRRGGGPNMNNEPRTRKVTRRDTYGRCLSLANEAFREGLVLESDIRFYLQMLPEELNE